MRPLVLLLIAGLAAGCVDGAADEPPAAPNQLHGGDKADGGGPLWAGLTSYTIERYTSDPCDDGRNALGDDPLIYDEWARERAGVRNLCFEVWKPGVTDTDDPNFWRELDVRVHYRFGNGEEHWAYVPSIDRRGHNRRYAWALDYALDPFLTTPSVATAKVPIHIISESDGWAYVQADLEVYFTVNGQILNSPSNHPFTIRYQGYLREPTLAPNPNGYVLYDLVSCEQGAARFGSGAGYFAADLRDPAGVATLGQGLDGSLIYGAQIARSGDLVSMIYDEQIPVAGQTLPGFDDPAGLHITPDGTAMRVDLDVYDCAAGTTRQLSATFTGCVATQTN